jgi:hypothetical protein
MKRLMLFLVPFFCIEDGAMFDNIADDEVEFFAGIGVAFMQMGLVGVRQG